MGVAYKNLSVKSDFLRCIRVDLDLMMDVEIFAQIDRIDRIFRYERNQCSFLEGNFIPWKTRNL